MSREHYTGNTVLDGILKLTFPGTFGSTIQGARNAAIVLGNEGSDRRELQRLPLDQLHVTLCREEVMTDAQRVYKDNLRSLPRLGERYEKLMHAILREQKPPAIEFEEEVRFASEPDKDKYSAYVEVKHPGGEQLQEYVTRVFNLINTLMETGFNPYAYVCEFERVFHMTLATKSGDSRGAVAFPWRFDDAEPEDPNDMELHPIYPVEPVSQLVEFADYNPPYWKVHPEFKLPWRKGDDAVEVGEGELK